MACHSKQRINAQPYPAGMPQKARTGDHQGRRCQTSDSTEEGKHVGGRWQGVKALSAASGARKWRTLAKRGVDAQPARYHVH